MPETISFGESLKERIMAGIPMLGISTKEPDRVLREISALCQETEQAINEGRSKGKKFSAFTWSVSHGLEIVSVTPDARDLMQEYLATDDNISVSPMQIVEILKHLESSTISNEWILVIVSGASYLFPIEPVRDFIREIAVQNRLNGDNNHRVAVLFMDANLNIPNDIAHWIFDVELDKLTRDQVIRVVSGLTQGMSQKMVTISEQGLEQLVQTLTGLTEFEIKHILLYCYRIHMGLHDCVLETAEQEAVKAIKSDGILQYIPKSQIDRITDLRGFDSLIEFIENQRISYTNVGRQIGLDMPKGITLIGVPGTGKSAVAKAIARVLGMPLYIMDVSSVFGSLVGESESRMRNALKSISSQQGAVLLLDEADKALAGMNGGVHDSGVSKRVFGQLLTWLAEKKDETYVIVTMNKIDGIPPEFLRKGRFDEVFYTDMPDKDTRKDIIRVHFEKRGFEFNPNQNELEEIANATHGYVGSELEELVKHCLRESLRKSGTPCFDKDIILSYIAGTKTMSILNKEEIGAIRKFCADHATPVCKRKQESVPTQKLTINLNREVLS